MAKAEYTKMQTQVLDAIRAAGTPSSPTQIGVSLGYPVVSASSRVAPALRQLLAKGKVAKTRYSHNSVVYSLV